MGKRADRKLSKSKAAEKQSRAEEEAARVGGPGIMRAFFEQHAGASLEADDRLAERLARLPHEQISESVDPSSLAGERRLAWLTERERIVLRLYLACQNSKEIARALGTRVQTVKNQLASIEHKLGVGSREELLAFMFALLR